MSEPGNGVEYRFRKIEDVITQFTKRLDNIDEHGSRRVGVIETELSHVRNDLADLASEIRELRADMRDTRHRLTSTEGAVSMMGRTVDSNSTEVKGLRRAIIAGCVSVSSAVVVGIITSWIAFGGPP